MRMIRYLSLFTLVFCFAANAETGKLDRLLPDGELFDGWRLAFNPELAEGEDLYLLIDGGAEVYHEYGFKRALAAEYRNTDGRRIGIEIYQMFDSSAAYGIFSFKAGEKGKKAEIGDGAVIEDYYLNFYKSDFHVSITLLDADPGKDSDLRKFAEAISAKIPSGGKAPLLVKLIPNDGILIHYPKYIKGYLALMNNLDLGLGNVFGFHEGVIGKWTEGTAVVLKYNDAQEADRWFKNASEAFKKSVRYSRHMQVENRFSTDDEKGGQISVTLKNNFIIIAAGNSEDWNAKIADQLSIVIE